jgi:2-polyprenyl-6-hydroxyphenyl methylase/3-demethylubiquinone-9 3-methyltransferase
VRTAVTVHLPTSSKGVPRLAEQRLPLAKRPPTWDTNSKRPRNDPRQYDDLAAEWWRADGEFAALHWLARARADLIPPAQGNAQLVDLGCGGGLLAPHIAGYRHVGVDLSPTAAAIARSHGTDVIRADVCSVPLRDACADVVVAGEIFEHVVDLQAAVAEAARVLRPGGTVVVDTINDTLLARILLVSIGERLPGGPPHRCHDPGLFVPPQRLSELFVEHGVRLQFRGLRSHAGDYVRFLVDRTRPVRLAPTKSLSVLYQAVGRKETQ